jgi:acyl carrier protein
MADITEKQKEEISLIILKHYKINKVLDIKPNLKFKQDLGFDSIDLIELIMEIEEHFDIIISDSDWERIEIVGDTYEAINNKI